MADEKRGDYKPEWVPDNASECFTTNVMAGVDGGHDGLPGFENKHYQSIVSKKRKVITTQDYIKGILAKDRNMLARAITLVESNSPAHMKMAQEILQEILPHTGKSVRIGISGVPGAGKSTFIESFGNLLCDENLKVAVLAVDPSSSITKGSILGDKTRMETLSRNQNAFIRPTPSGGTLGGVARKSRETILLCEAAGYDVIIIETVGVGQSEVTVRSLCDFFLLLVLTGAGDELQGMKKGVMEIADAIVVNKADGSNKNRAETAKADYERIVQLIRPATKGWKTQTKTCSALHNQGLDEIWQMVLEFVEITKTSHIFNQRRTSQSMDWVQQMVQEYLFERFDKHPAVKQTQLNVRKKINSGEISATMAATLLINAYEGTESIL